MVDRQELLGRQLFSVGLYIKQGQMSATVKKRAVPEQSYPAQILDVTPRNHCDERKDTDHSERVW